MEIFNTTNKIAAMTAAKHLRLKSRIKEVIEDNNDPDILCFKLYTVKVQVKILGIWVTVWAETCDFSDGDTRPYIKYCAEVVHRALTENI